MLFNEQQQPILNSEDNRAEKIKDQIESANDPVELQAIYMKLGTSELPKNTRHEAENLIAEKLIQDKIGGGLYTGDFGANQVISDMIYDGYQFNPVNQEFQEKYDEAFGHGKWIELLKEINQHGH